MKSEKYQVVYCDPPWFFNARANVHTRFGGGATKHYPVMADQELIDMRPTIDELSDINCALFMWASLSRLDFAIELIKHWGFRYCATAFIWVKRTADNGWQTGPGYYTCSNAEAVLLGIRGSMPPREKLVQQIVCEERMSHSRKPSVVRKRIEQMYPDANKIELFARPSGGLFGGEIPGWTLWGNEVKQR
ncbi:MAG: MT-A70 family methyltransferase [bacterium]|nr:MT-A70 family methyltransferase [bacterium]